MKKGDRMKKEESAYIKKYILAIIFSNIIVWFSWVLQLFMTINGSIDSLWVGFLMRIVLSTIPFISLFHYAKGKYIENKLTKIYYLISIISMLLLPTLFFILAIEIGYGGTFW